MIDLKPDEKEALHKGARNVKYRFEVLSKEGVKKTEIEAINASISVDVSDAVKRQAKFTFRENPLIDYLTDRIRPVMYLQLDDGEWARWNKGKYLFMNPKGVSGGMKYVEVSCYDESMILQQDKFDQKKAYAAGTKYTDILGQILHSSGLKRASIVESRLEIPADIVLDDSKNKLQWFNELCAQINYTDLYVDDNGIANTSPYKQPDAANVDYTYKTDEFSVILPERTIEDDFWNVPNIVKRTMSRPDLEPLVAIWINSNPANKFSTVARGMNIVDVGTVDLVASQEELQGIVNRIGFEKQQVSQTVLISTLNMPHHEANDVLELHCPEIIGVFQETSWSMDMIPGGDMKHTLKRVIYYQ